MDPHPGGERPPRRPRDRGRGARESRDGERGSKRPAARSQGARKTPVLPYDAETNPFRAPREDPDLEAQRAYDASGQAGVGRTVGFNRGQSAAPTGQKRKAIYAENYYPDGTLRHTLSGRFRDGVNGGTRKVSDAIVAPPRPGQSGRGRQVAKGGADAISAILTSPLHFLADLSTLGDTYEKPEIRTGAGLNVARDLALPGVMRAGGKIVKATPLYKTAEEAVRNSIPISLTSRFPLPGGDATLLRIDWKGDQLGRLDWHPLPSKANLPKWTWGRSLPHYHRKGRQVNGKTVSGQGIGRHRPYENGSKPRW